MIINYLIFWEICATSRAQHNIFLELKLIKLCYLEVITQHFLKINCKKSFLDENIL